MSPDAPAFDDIPANWDLTVLDTPVVLDIPDTIPEQPNPLLITSLDAMVAALLGGHDASDKIAQLAHTGVVALRTSSGCLEVHETLLGWTLRRSWGDPDPADLATAARLRAHRLAGERRHPYGTQP